MFSKIINTLFPKEVIHLKSIIAQGAMLVDVRIWINIKSGHVKGSVNIPPALNLLNDGFELRIKIP